MAPAADEGERVAAESVQQWRDWLAAHHADSPGAWLVSYKKHVDRPGVDYDDAVTEALAYGWIDSIKRRLDDERSLQWFSPRRPTSGWSASNKIRIERLYAEGRMAPAGQAAIDLARANGTWFLLDDVEQLVVPPDLAAALEAVVGARQQWDQWPRTLRRAQLLVLVQAKTAATREKRVSAIVHHAAEGTRPT